MTPLVTIFCREINGTTWTMGDWFALPARDATILEAMRSQFYG